MVIVRVLYCSFKIIFIKCEFLNSEYSHPLTVPDNGRIIGPTSCVKPDYGRAFLGVNCRFMCSPNFSMIGASSTTCGMNGWSTRAPRCIKAEVRSHNTAVRVTGNKLSALDWRQRSARKSPLCIVLLVEYFRVPNA